MENNINARNLPAQYQTIYQMKTVQISKSDTKTNTNPSIKNLSRQSRLKKKYQVLFIYNMRR